MTWFEITKTALFHGARSPMSPAAGASQAPPHPYSFVVEATVRGQCVDGQGWIARFDTLDRDLKTAAAALDHRLRGDQSGLDTTDESLCLWFAGWLKPGWPGLRRIVIGRPGSGQRYVLAL